MIHRLITIIRQAGAQSESDTDRNGFLSYHAESHAAGLGIAAGWAYAVTGNAQLLGVVLPAVTAGLRAKNKEYGKILTDVKQEPHYAAGGLVVGWLLGLVVGLVA